MKSLDSDPVKEDPKQYSFTVAEAEDVDLARISSENADKDLLIRGGDESLLMLRNTFLGQFVEDDEIYINSILLYPEWGNCNWKAIERRNGICFTPDQNAIPTKNHRCALIYDCFLEETKEELWKAREYKSKLKITVEVI